MRRKMESKQVEKTMTKVVKGIESLPDIFFFEGKSQKPPPNLGLSIQELIQVGAQAPFGQGIETAGNPTLRKTLQVDAEEWYLERDRFENTTKSAWTSR